jgi:CheY-like chemotaxis protein
MANVLLVDDDDTIRSMLAEVLLVHGFQVTAASSVPEALRFMSSESYDVLLSDLHMPGAGDGLTVVSAMRHSNPKAVTLLLSAFPEMAAAAKAILRQADEILLKPMDMMELVGVIEKRLLNGPVLPRQIESVAEILKRTTDAAIHTWYENVQTNHLLMATEMDRDQRCRHLPALFRELISRLNSTNPIGSVLISLEAAEHGLDRRMRGYSAAMLVEESRILQVSIFNTLQDNLATIDFSILLNGVMVIADEIDSQLSQAMTSFTQTSPALR